MRYSVEVTKCAAKPVEVEHFVVPMDADSPDDAARRASLIAAKHFFPVGGDVSFFQRHGDRYLCAAGHYRWDSGYGVTDGATLSIRVHNLTP